MNRAGVFPAPLPFRGFNKLLSHEHLGKECSATLQQHSFLFTVYLPDKLRFSRERWPPATFARPAIGPAM